ncbi:hypothetical protein MRX96_049270 [Rhipicephalus microplus]
MAAGEEANAAEKEAVVRNMVDHTLSLHMALGEGRVTIWLLYNKYAEKLSFPTIYLGVPRAIYEPGPTLFSMASSEIHRTYLRGAIPRHVLYMAMKVTRYSLRDSTMTFRTNHTTMSFMQQHPDTSFRAFLNKVLNRELGFLSGVSNIVHY